MKTPRIKVNDRVKIIKPDFFLRCGYPLDYESELKKVLEKEGNKIESFLKSVGVVCGGKMVVTKQKIGKAIAYALMHQAGFGGQERKIYTHSLPQFAEVETVVHDYRFVKTGVWTKGSSFDGEYDPNYLANEETHRILTVGLVAQLPNMLFPDMLKIDAVNVTLVECPKLRN